MRKHGLEISQLGLDPDRWAQWAMTKKRHDTEVHRFTEEHPGWCADPYSPPCAAFAEIMAPVFSRDAWRCVWYMIQVQILKLGLSLLRRGRQERKSSVGRVKERCQKEWDMFKDRMMNSKGKY